MIVMTDVGGHLGTIGSDMMNQISPEINRDCSNRIRRDASLIRRCVLM